MPLWNFLIPLIISSLLPSSTFFATYLQICRSHYFQFLQISWQESFSVKFPARIGFSEKYPDSGATTATLFVPPCNRPKTSTTNYFCKYRFCSKYNILHIGYICREGRMANASLHLFLELFDKD